MITFVEEILDKGFKPKVKIVEQQLETIKRKLEEKVKEDNLTSYVLDDIRDIQCIIDEAKKKSQDENLEHHKKIREILKKIEEAINKIKAVPKNHTEHINHQIFDDLTNILEDCQNQLKIFDEKLEFILQSIEPITQMKQELQESSDKNTFRIWVEPVELLVDGLEVLLDICPDFELGEYEDLVRHLLVVSSSQTHKNQKKDKYKRRIKFAASHLLSILRERKKTTVLDLDTEEYTIVNDLRTLAHAKYKLAHKMMMQEPIINKFKDLETEEDISEMAIKLTSK